MDRDCITELHSLRKRGDRDEDGEMDKLMKSMASSLAAPHRPYGKTRVSHKSDPKSMTMSELLEEGPGRRKGSKTKEELRNKRDDKRERKSGNEKEREDCRSSTASKNSECQPTTSHSFKNRGHSQKWREKDTRLFFKALSLFGTDFSMVALLLKGRERSQLINKYHKEERDDPKRVEASLRQHRQAGSKVLIRCNNILAGAAPTTDQPRRVRGGSGSSLDSLDNLIYAELDEQIALARRSSHGSSGLPT